MIYHIAETTSTNDLAREERYGHGDVICAERQTAGRGQRGHTWTSPEGVNLLFSVVLCPTFLPAGEQFLLSQAVALALVDTLGTCGIDARIKWTNDIYAGDRKLVGILIEHHLAGGRLARTVAGIGINVNQTEFDPALPNPTSMALEAGRTFDREEVLNRFHAALMRRYAALEAGDRVPLAEEYRRRMYRIDAPQAFRLPDGTRFTGVIRGVRAGGALQVEHPDGTLHDYLFREIEFEVKKSPEELGMKKYDVSLCRRRFKPQEFGTRIILPDRRPERRDRRNRRNGLRDRTAATETDSSMQKR